MSDFIFADRKKRKKYLKKSYLKPKQWPFLFYLLNLIFTINN